MADEQPEIPDSIIIDPDRLDDVRVVLSLPHLGELIAHLALQLTTIRGIDPPDYEGPEMKALAISGWRFCMHMADREHFKASVATDLEMLDLLSKPAPPEPEHKSEFGL